MSYKLSRQAELDVEDILVQGILAFGEFQAARYQASLFRTFELLSDMPLLGRKSERNRSNERRFVHNSHVIYYFVEGDGVLINAIVHGALIVDIWADD
jgi:toxin ParE1/3/4